MAINVMLNKSDQTDFLKLSRHGLEARNDSDSFESVRGTVAVTSGTCQRRWLCKRAGVVAHVMSSSAHTLWPCRRLVLRSHGLHCRHPADWLGDKALPV